MTPSSSPGLDRFDEIVAQLRAGEATASAELRERVREVAAREASRRRLALPWRRLALVLVPACLLAVVGAALLHGLVTSGSTRKVEVAESVRGTATQPAETHTLARPKTGEARSRPLRPSVKAAAPVPRTSAADSATGAYEQLVPNAKPPTTTLSPSRTRAQRYGVDLTVRLRTLGALSRATQSALRTTRALGGYVLGADLNRPGGRRGDAYLTLRVPVGTVQTALLRFSQLGTIVAQHVSVQDVQGSVDATYRQTAQLRRQVVRDRKRLDGRGLSAKTRRELRAKLRFEVARLAQLRKRQAATLRSAAFASVSLTLTTPAARAAVATPQEPGRLGRALHDARTVLEREAAIGLYAAVVLAPLFLVAVALLYARRLWRRHEGLRLLESRR